MIHKTQSQNFEAYIWDVGHGLSITLVTPWVNFPSGGFPPTGRRRVIQIDAGTNGDYNFSPIKHLLDNYGLSVIDCLILTHPDQDHISELGSLDEYIKNGLEIKTLVVNKTIPHHTISEDPLTESEAKTTYKNLASTYTYGIADFDNIYNPLGYGGAQFYCTHLSYSGEPEHNNISVVASITFGNTQIIVPGDLASEGTKGLIAANKMPLPVQTATRILIAPHHGRESAEPATLLEHFKPHIVLASAKEGDEYTDDGYSRSPYVAGYSIMESDEKTFSTNKFRATKGEAFHISTGVGSPNIKRLKYKPAPIPNSRLSFATILR